MSSAAGRQGDPGTASGSQEVAFEGDARRILAAFLRHPRYEVIPLADTVEQVVERVPPEVKLTVTASPSKGMEATLDLTEQLAARGFEVVPHISARLVRDQGHLAEILARVAALGLHEVFVVAGDAREPAGKFADSMALLGAMAAQKGELREIGVTGYPESHPFIDDDVTIQAMWDKRQYATYIVSNLCFDPRLIGKWVARVRRRGVDLPVYVGMAGVADPTKLLRISSRIGVGESTRFLRAHTNWFLRMVKPGGYSADRFLAGLRQDLAAPSRRVAGLHIFTFNEIQATEEWRRRTLARLQAGAAAI
jgi:methylenetetrahydrofolate reductase (NADPH)